MDISTLITLVAFAEHCIGSYAFGHTRTRRLLSYIRPGVHHTQPSYHSDLHAYPMWHTTGKRHFKQNNSRHRAWTTKRDIEYNAAPLRSDKTYYADTKSKRFFPFYPFVLGKSLMSTPYSVFKSTYIGNNLKPSSDVKPFVDHFAGVRSMAYPLHSSAAALEPELDPELEEQTAPAAQPDNPADTLDAPSQDTAQDSTASRTDKLNAIKELLQSTLFDDSNEEEDTDDALNTDFAQTQHQPYLKDSEESANGDPFEEMFDSPPLQARKYDTFSQGGSSDSAAHGHAAFTSLSANVAPVSESAARPSNPLSDPGVSSAASPSPEGGALSEMLASLEGGPVNTRSGPDSYSAFDNPYADTMYYDNYGWGYGPGAFETDEAGCEGIETRSCLSDDDCSCYGIYFCIEARCQITSGDYEDEESEPSSPYGDITWHDGPIDIHALN